MASKLTALIPQQNFEKVRDRIGLILSFIFVVEKIVTKCLNTYDKA